MGHITSLLTLQIIFADYDNQQDLDEQVRCSVTDNAYPELIHGAVK